MAFLAVMILSLLLLFHDKTDVEADKSNGSIQLVAAADDDTYIEGDCIDAALAAFAVPPRYRNRTTLWAFLRPFDF